MKHIITFVLLAALVSCRFPAYAEDGGTEPRWFTADVQDPNTLGTLLTAQLLDTETLAAVQYLRLSGTLGSSDISLIKSTLTGLVEVDMQGLNVTTLPDRLFYNTSSSHSALRRVVLPSTLTATGSYIFGYCNNLEEVVAPSTLTEVTSYTFDQCSKLASFNFADTQLKTIGSNAFVSTAFTEITFPPTIATIERTAFGNISTLKTITFPPTVELETLGTNAFSYCYALETVVVPPTVEMSSGIFYQCSSLREAILPEGLKKVPYQMFYNCALTSINIPESVEVIGAYAFCGCQKLTEVTMQEGLHEIGESAFYRCSLLSSLTIPSTVYNFGSSPFYGSGITTLTCKALLPPNLLAGLFSSDASSSISCTLRVPQASLAIYRSTDGWSRFSAYEALDADAADKYFPESISTIKECVITSPTGQPEGWKPRVNMLYGYDSFQEDSSNYYYDFGRLRVLGDERMQLSELNLTYHEYNRRCYGSNTSSTYDNVYSQLITQAPITADRVITKVFFDTYSSTDNRWHFISFPYDVDLGDHDFASQGHYFVLYSYDGARRAAGENGWVRLADDAVLSAGKGYIINPTGYVNGISTSNENLIFHSCSSAASPVTISEGDVTVELADYPSAYSHNAGWNFIGNPFMSYYDTRFMDFDGPITVRKGDSFNSSTYEACSLIDDQKILVPGEAFFVQRSATADRVIFRKEGRQFSRVARTLETASTAGYNNSYNNSGASRRLINLTLADADGEADRTRVVINTEASSTYEPRCDASKFWAEDATSAQICSVVAGVAYAINELPLPEGDIALRVHTPVSGHYTIAMAQPVDDYSVELVDCKTGRITDLGAGTCEYEAESGDSPLRFALRVTPHLTGLGATVGESLREQGDCWYNLQGIRLGGEPTAPGIYIRGGRKVIVK